MTGSFINRDNPCETGVPAFCGVFHRHGVFEASYNPKSERSDLPRARDVG